MIASSVHCSSANSSPPTEGLQSWTHLVPNTQLAAQANSSGTFVTSFGQTANSSELVSLMPASHHPMVSDSYWSSAVVANSQMGNGASATYYSNPDGPRLMCSIGGTSDLVVSPVPGSYNSAAVTSTTQGSSGTRCSGSLSNANALKAARLRKSKCRRPMLLM